MNISKKYECNPTWVVAANAIMIFALAALLSVFLSPLRINWNSSLLNALHPAIWGYGMVYCGFTWLILDWKGKSMSISWLMAAAVFGALVVDLPIHIWSWTATLVSLGDLVARLAGILFGWGLYIVGGRRKKTILILSFMVLLAVMVGAAQALDSLVFAIYNAGTIAP